MASRFAAWLRVTPSPATIAESSAILKQLKKQGRVTAFIKKPQDGDDGNGASYYTIFSHEPPSLRTKFQVPVYHNLPSPQDEDPFNIRGLQTRKPLPEPKTFHCRLETVKHEDMDKQRQWITQQNSYHGNFKIDRTAMSAELRTVYAETGAPPGVAEGLRNFQDQPGRHLDESVVEKPKKQRRLKMHSLVETQAEAKDSPSSFRGTRLQRSA